MPLPKRQIFPSTFDQETCKSLIGQQLDGTVEKVDCEPYEFTSEETGEIMILDCRRVFVKEGETIGIEEDEEVAEEEPELV